MSPSDAQGRELLTPETERALARQAAVAALTAIGQIHTAEAGAGSSAGSGSRGAETDGAGFGGAGSGGAGSGGAGSGGAGSGGAGSGASDGFASGTSGADTQELSQSAGNRTGRPVGFASPERSIRRAIRGSWASRG